LTTNTHSPTFVQSSWRIHRGALRAKHSVMAHREMTMASCGSTWAMPRLEVMAAAPNSAAAPRPRRIGQTLEVSCTQLLGQQHGRDIAEAVAGADSVVTVPVPEEIAELSDEDRAGQYQLGRPAERISVRDVLTALRGERETLVPAVDQVFERIEKRLGEVVEHETLADLLRQ